LNHEKGDRERKMTSFFTSKMDRNLEYSLLHERKRAIASALNIELQKNVIDQNRYEERGKAGNLELIFLTEGEGTPKLRKHGYFEVIKLFLNKVSAKKGTIEESISLNYENSELYTSFRDRDFWIEYVGTDLTIIKKKFESFKDQPGETLRDRVLREFGRQAEKAYKSPGVDSVFYSTIAVPLDGLEDLMYQIMTGDFSKSLNIPSVKRDSAPQAAPAQPPPAPKPTPAPKQEAPQQPPAPPIELQPKQDLQQPKQAPPPKAPVQKEVIQKPEPPVQEAGGDTEEGIILLSQKKYEEAVEYYKTKAKKSPKDPEGWFGLSACLFLTGEIKKCTLYYNRCLDVDPQFDLFSRLVKLSGEEYENLLGLAENLLTMELQSEAQKYILFLQEQQLPPELQGRVQNLVSS
jgi:tetratricopeptide (TPR) repeat protein